jgi:hypothetical protein
LSEYINEGRWDEPEQKGLVRERNYEDILWEYKRDWKHCAHGPTYSGTVARRE